MRFRPGLFYLPVSQGAASVPLKRHRCRLQQGWLRLQGSNWVGPVGSRRAFSERGWIRFDDTLDPYAPEQISESATAARFRWAGTLDVSGVLRKGEVEVAWRERGGQASSLRMVDSYAADGYRL
ncbi:hypothetical protein GFL18_02465 [Rhizobium leguminosarum bv. viciae]|nr:hypothetical protein [Rhizobium leguminosarum bv. viciae]